DSPILFVGIAGKLEARRARDVQREIWNTSGSATRRKRNEGARRRLSYHLVRTAGTTQTHPQSCHQKSCSQSMHHIRLRQNYTRIHPRKPRSWPYLLLRYRGCLEAMSHSGIVDIVADKDAVVVHAEDLAERAIGNVNRGVLTLN